MTYVDSSIQTQENTLAGWMISIVDAGVLEFQCQSGYFTIDGASPLLATVADCARNGATIRFLLGSNGGVTLASHVSYLLGALGTPRENVSLGIVSFENSLFHPKVYLFKRANGSRTAYVGSANLTRSGVSGLNVEAGIILDSEAGDPEEIFDEISDRIGAWFEGSAIGLSNVSGPIDIENLIARGTLSLTRPPRRHSEGIEDGVAGDPNTPNPARRTPLIRIDPVNIENQSTEVRPALERTAPSARLSSQNFALNTEASYHYPQGTHLGHILSILFYFSVDRSSGPYDDDFIRLKGNLGEGRKAAYRRQIKYKLQAAMELGLVTDARYTENIESFIPALTESGRQVWSLIEPIIDLERLSYVTDENGAFSTRMPLSASGYNDLIRSFFDLDPDLKTRFVSLLLSVPAVDQMLQFLRECPEGEILKSQIYSNFFSSAAVVDFCNSVGVDPATDEGAKHRCPFLLNILETCGLITQRASSVEIV